MRGEDTLFAENDDIVLREFYTLYYYYCYYFCVPFLSFIYEYALRGRRRGEMVEGVQVNGLNNSPEIVRVIPDDKKKKKKNKKRV